MRITYASQGKFSSLAKQFRKLANHELQVRYHLTLTESRNCLARLSGYQSEYELKQCFVDADEATILSRINLDAAPLVVERARENLPSLSESIIKSILRRIFGVVTHRLMIAPSRYYSLYCEEGHLRSHNDPLPKLSLDSSLTDKHLIHFMMADVDTNCSYVETHPANNCPSVFEFMLKAWSDRKEEVFVGLPQKLLIQSNLEKYLDRNVRELLEEQGIELEVSGPNSRKGVRLCGEYDKYLSFEIDMAFSKRNANEIPGVIKAYRNSDLFIAKNIPSTLSVAHIKHQAFERRFTNIRKSVKPALNASPSGGRLDKYIKSIAKRNAPKLSALLKIKSVNYLEADRLPDQMNIVEVEPTFWRLDFSSEIHDEREAFLQDSSAGSFLLHPAMESLRKYRGFITPAIHIEEYRWCREQAVCAVINNLPNTFTFGEDRMPYSAGTHWEVYQVFALFAEGLLRENWDCLIAIETAKPAIEKDLNIQRFEELKLAIYILILLYFFDPTTFICEDTLDLDDLPYLIHGNIHSIRAFPAIEAKKALSALKCDFDNVRPDYATCTNEVHSLALEYLKRRGMEPPEAYEASSAADILDSYTLSQSIH